MINKIRIWLAYRKYDKACKAYKAKPSLANLGRMAKANNAWYFLMHPDCIKPAW